MLCYIIMALSVVVYGDMTEEAKNQILQLHNEHRSQLGATNMFKLDWDEELAAASENWANRCVYDHKGRGENLARSKPATPLTIEKYIKEAFDGWYSEKKDHSYGSGRCVFFNSCHYTQLAWHDTTKIGCAYKTCPYLTNAARDSWGNNAGEKVFEIGGPACSHEDCENLPCEDGLCIGEKKVKCEDENKNCKAWSKGGQCQINHVVFASLQKKDFMLTKVSDDISVTKTPEDWVFPVSDAVECADKHEKCEKWSTEDQCAVNPTYMLVTCPKSCQQC